jgi:uncharacterized DUF497 family protein
MPWLSIIWTERAERKIAQHGVSPQEVVEVLEDPLHTTSSASSGLPLAFGFTAAGRWLVVVYEPIDAATVSIVTAFEPAEP